MIDKEKCLGILAKYRTDEVMVASMGVTVPWSKFSDHRLDYASVGSAMGHTADFALGIALAQPNRKVLALNGDGSMLMCLGTLATIAGLEKPARNFYLFVCHNGTYEVTGNQHIPGRSGFSFSAIAKGVGLEKVYDFNTAESLDASLPVILKEDGPTLITLEMTPANEPPPHRSPNHPVRYLTATLAESTHELKDALV
ncbi:MAG: thiamine pyrophosphate-dependent enzyme [Candidatus Poribacteria bacterium]|nr:thiamine pyrophosphate-dependent enzyme [Candidatus Poribacteria bacterium]MDE0502697.1 thiamine pyrophosphate-dependent enzyme [Candidatus Poribacteria bacterium]